VTYRIIRHTDSDIIQELFFRLQSQEQTFEQLVKDFSQVEEGQGDGLIGPVHVGSLHPSLTKALFSISPGEILPPFQIGEWFIILRLEQLIPVRLDEPMREFLLEELFQNWLQQKIGSLLEV
jgi:parvulin-like peptidyl-prolyl isomerase